MKAKKGTNLMKKKVNYEKVFRQMFSDPVVKLDELINDMFIINKDKWDRLEKLVPPDKLLKKKNEKDW